MTVNELVQMVAWGLFWWGVWAVVREVRRQVRWARWRKGGRR